ncbi:MAG: HlyD family secretion protein [Gammaproteobacteria bacterium]|nr:HlyD family secretion protein [Gammaproteobacteria bacterium]
MHPVLRLLTILFVFVSMATCGYGGMHYWRTYVRPFETTDNAYVRAHMTQVSPKATGYVQAVHFNDNQAVHAGEVLVTIDDAEYRARVAQAEAQAGASAAKINSLQAERAVQAARVAQQSATIASASADQERAAKDLKRVDELVADGAVSAQSRDAADATSKQAVAHVAQSRSAHVEAESQLLALAAQIAEAQAAFKVAEAALTVAKVDLANTQIVAPLSGTIGNRSVQVGQMVQPGAVLAYLIPSREFFVEANFKETQIEDMRVGQPVKITIDAYPQTHFTGKIDSTAPASGAEFSLLPPENATGNFTKIVRRVPVKIAFDEATDFSRLKPGLSTVVKVRVR